MKIDELLENWDSGTVDLNRGNGLYKIDNVRLRDCLLSFNKTTSEYYLIYREVTFGLYDVFNLRIINN
jgi:hypothetical protein